MTRLSPAEHLLQSLGITDPSEIDLEAIADDQSAEVISRNLNGCEAQIIGRGNRAVIVIRSDSNLRRRRFSLAHELGHWHHHRGRTFLCRPDDINNPSRRATDPERVADGYAADLLLPAYMFRPRANELRRATVESAETLAEQFDVSLTATMIRLVEMGPEPALLVCHSQRGMKWFVRGNEIPSRWWPRKELDPDSFAFDVVFGSESRTRRALMNADSWFDRREAERFQIYEQTVRGPSNTSLTLLTIGDGDMLEDVD